VVAGDGGAADEAVYLECRALAVPDELLDGMLDVFVNGPHGNQEGPPRRVEDYLGGASLALYQAMPERAYVMDVTHDERGHRIDRRREIDLRAGLG
jgi:hypothetical protein